MWAIPVMCSTEDSPAGKKMLIVLGAVYAKVRIADDQEVLRVDRSLVVERGEIED
jgi:hypothetical protein